MYRRLEISFRFKEEKKVKRNKSWDLGHGHVLDSESLWAMDENLELSYTHLNSTISCRLQWPTRSFKRFLKENATCIYLYTRNKEGFFLFLFFMYMKIKQTQKDLL